MVAQRPKYVHFRLESVSIFQTVHRVGNRIHSKGKCRHFFMADSLMNSCAVPTLHAYRYIIPARELVLHIPMISLLFFSTSYRLSQLDQVIEHSQNAYRSSSKTTTMRPKDKDRVSDLQVGMSIASCASIAYRWQDPQN